MVIYIPNHLKESIPLLKTMSDMISEYGKNYSTRSIDSFDDYYSSISINSVKKYIELCLEGQESSQLFKNNINTKEDIVNYLVKLFYSVKGTLKIFDYMKKYLGVKFSGNITYTINEVIFNIDEISTDNIQLYVDSMKGFLSSLLYYGDLVSEISKINLTLESNLTVSVTNDIQKYKEFTVTELEV